MTSVALICTANRCRSVMAHAIFVAEAASRELAIQVYSAGVYDFSDQPPIADTIATCLKNNTPLIKDPTWVGELPLDSIDRFLVMEQHHANVLIRDFKVAPERVSLLGEFDPHGRGSEIDDPFDRGRVVYDASYKQIRDCIVNYLDTTAELHNSAT
jgi:protein-tyrosine phosphatase